MVRVSRACICGSDVNLDHSLAPDMRVCTTSA